MLGQGRSFQDPGLHVPCKSAQEHVALRKVLSARNGAGTIVALIANIVAIVIFIVKNVGGDDGSKGGGIASEFSLKLQERVEECVLFIMVGTVNTESLCFLTTNEKVHTSFRKISILTNLIEGVPILLLETVFSYTHGW